MLIMTLIFVSTTNFIIETVEEIQKAAGDVLFVIEATCIAVFTVEVLLRLLSTPSCYSFFTDFFNWIDMVSIVPFYIEQALPGLAGAGSLGVVRVVRLVRVARIVKVSRYSQSVRIFSTAMKASMRPLAMLVFLVSIAMIMFSSAMYFSELTTDGCRSGGWRDVGAYVASYGVIVCDPNDARWTQLDSNGTFRFEFEGASLTFPCGCDDPNPFTSIPATFWWCIVTMTTVGFGDHVPRTLGGRLVAAVTMVCGIIILALPITVIGSNFSRVLREIQQERMLSELNKIDKDGDGLVDEEELALMIQHMAAVAGDLPKELIPDAKQLLKQYDADGSGTLTPEEVGRLRSDMHELLGTGQSRPAGHTAASGVGSGDESAPVASRDGGSISKRRSGSHVAATRAKEADGDGTTFAAGTGLVLRSGGSVGGFTGEAGGGASLLITGSASAAHPASAEISGAAAGIGSGWANSRGPFEDDDAAGDGGVPSLLPSAVSAPVPQAGTTRTGINAPTHASELPSPSYPASSALSSGNQAAIGRMGPAAMAVTARLEEIEDRVDDKLIAIIDLLRKMNAAVSSASSTDAVM